MNEQEIAAEEAEIDDEENDAPEPEPSAVVFAPPNGALPPNEERSYRVVAVRPAADGTVKVDMRTMLPTRVYDRRVAVRYVQFEARHMPDSGDRPLLVLLDPADRVIGAYQAGSGRAAPTHVMRAVRRAISVLIPPRHRTSRRPSKPGALIKSRKTSRRIGRQRLR